MRKLEPEVSLSRVGFGFMDLSMKREVMRCFGWSSIRPRRQYRLSFSTLNLRS